jgi:F-type H+-transporting ATPase subunit b
VEFNWTTFVLEIINFLVLVWILKRFLYKPVIGVIAQRKAAIEKTMVDAKTMEEGAQALKLQYENRLGDWELEKEKAQAKLLDEIKAERARLMEGLQTSLAQEREKNRVLEARRMDEIRRGMEEEALAQGRQFASRLLSRLPAPELEAKIVELALEDLSRLSDEKRQMIRAAYQEAGSKVLLASAFPLRATQRDALTKAMSHLIGQDLSCELRQDRNLISGLRITIGPWVLRANLQDELESFGEAAHGSS